MASWAERVPAAIEKVEKRLRGAHVYFHQGVDGSEVAAFTATELALAKALWDTWRNEYGWALREGKMKPPAALRAFCEKVEAL